MAMTLSRCSIPSMRSCLPGRAFMRFSSTPSFLYSTSLTSELLPLPLTPVTQMNMPSGKVTSMFFRLFSRAPRTVRNLPFPSRRCAGSSMRFLPLRYWPVRLLGSAITCSGVPADTTCPPSAPAPGPMSMSQSAARMVSSSCSTTIRVLPRSRRRHSVASSLSLSRWCRPMEGSSRIYSTPMRLLPIWVARRIRWLSPPDNVPEARDRVR